MRKPGLNLKSKRPAEKPQAPQAPQPKEPESPPHPTPETGKRADTDKFEIVGLAPEEMPTEDFYGRPIGGEVSIEGVTGLGMEE